MMLLRIFNIRLDIFVLNSRLHYYKLCLLNVKDQIRSEHSEPPAVYHFLILSPSPQEQFTKNQPWLEEELSFLQ